MALVLQDRVSVNSTGSGTGNLALGSAYPGYRTFASCIPDGSLVYYAISNQAVGSDTEWEVGYGTYVLGTNTLVRNNGNSAETGVYSSSNANTYVNFTAGTNGLQVFITQPSEQAVFQDVDGTTTFPEGIISVVGPNATAPTFATTLSSFVSNEPSYSQLVVQNQSNDANASADVVAYNNLGDGSSYFIDMGIDSSTYNSGDYPIFQANDGYIFTGGNIAGTGAAGDISRLMIGTSTANSNVVIFGGSVNTNAVIATFAAATKNVSFANNITVTGQVNANSGVVTGFVYTSANTAAAANSAVLATKAYVDTFTSGINVHSACQYGTAAILPGTPTYYNGPGNDGVGATLTATSNGALVVDGVTLTSPANIGTRILVKNQVTQGNNGIYTVTTVGDGSNPYVLTRATDYDTGGTGAGAISVGDYVFVNAGNTNAYTAWVQTTTGTITINSTPIVFVQFSSVPIYTGTAPINVSGSTIALTGIVPTANGGTNLSSYTTGDVIYANATNTLTRRAIGASNSILVSNGSVPDWGTVALGSASAVSGTLGATNGGTGQSTYTLGDIIYSDATNSLAKLAGQTTTTQKFLSQTGTGTTSGAPVWDTIPAASITGLGTMSTQNAVSVAITGGTLNNVVIGGTTANAATFTTANATTFNGSGAGLTTLNGSNVSSGTVANARTTATNLNTASAIVARDASGNFAAGTITANLTGTASSATSATTATTATNIAGGAAGSIPYQTASGTTSLLATATGVLVGGTTPAYSTTPTLTGTNFSGIPNAALSNSSVTFNGVAVALGSSGSINTNNAVTFNSSGTGAASGTTFNGSTAQTISYNTIGAQVAGTYVTSVTGTAPVVSSGGTTPAISMAAATSLVSGYLTSTDWTTFNNKLSTAVTSAVAGTGVSVSGATGAVTFSIGQAVATSSNVQFNSIGVNTAGSGTAGEIRATNNITAYYSDDRLKNNLGNIPDALAKLKTLNGFYYEANQTAVDLGYEVKKEVGVSAQQVQAIMPEVVAPAPIDDKYLTVRYERLVPLLIEAIKELEAKVEALQYPKTGA